YKAKQVVFATDPIGGARTASGQGVGGRVRGVVGRLHRRRIVDHLRHAHAADANGYVQMPNVDPVQEMVNM
ncbi:flagellar basal body rod C-terminal domain-containing protein, partial [Burkholderia multivorans]|uniref:flagellar basal body rod C-terminal domain-containing protein n=1 Tax=Burkholderia multivorans TaxID=87883 RepID=UPI003F6E3137